MTVSDPGALAGRDVYPPHVLREYALVADGERGAIIGPKGDITWLCVPRWDSDAVFSSLLGGRGGYAITPTRPFVWGGFYEEGTLIWRSRWVTGAGIIECREALVFPGDMHRAVLLRRVIAVDADAEVSITVNPRADFGRRAFSGLHRRSGIWSGHTGNLHVRLSGAPDEMRHVSTADGLWGTLTVPAGRYHDLSLEISDQPLPDDPPDANVAWSGTHTGWAAAVPPLTACLEPRDARRSYAVLRGMTSSSSGMVAAATTSLPERAEAGRNYDYRYVWIRDQCYAGQAADAAGGLDLLDDAVRFVAGRLLEHGRNLKPAYTATGAPVPDQRPLDGLPGYPGGSNLIGNWVNQQFQLDAFGESLLLLAAAGRRDRLDSEAWHAAEIAAGVIGQRWTEPDAGIWEIDNQDWTHSRLICVAGLKAAASLPQAGGHTGDWLALADRILADTTRHAVHPTGIWQRSRTDPALDAALLIPPLRGAVAADDRRTIATLDAYLSALTEDGYAYRFRHDERPLADAEGSFTLCGFLVALALHQQGRSVPAARWYERIRACAGPPEIFSEEFDTHQHQLRGNLPQAFVHALHLETSARLAQSPERRG